MCPSEVNGKPSAIAKVDRRTRVYRDTKPELIN